MKTSLLFAVPAALFAVSVCAQSTDPGPLDGQWKTKQLTDKFWAEGACAADVNHDGKMDVLCGPYWYAGPDFATVHKIYGDEKSFTKKKADGTEEKIAGFEGCLSGKNGYSDNFLSYAYDFNGDGWTDYLVFGWPGKETFWYENPQGKDEPWKQHVVMKVTDNESPMLADVNGDKVPDVLCNSGGQLGYATMDPKNPSAEWAWHPISGAPDKRFQRYTHGIGCADINGDGRADILETQGWWEQPANWDGKTPWTKHAAKFGEGGAQMYGLDVNGDGKMDIITCLNPHGYGLAWFEQTATGWTQHLITGTKTEKGETGVTFTQPHAIDIADMNGDGLPDIVTGKRVWAHGPTGDVEPGAPGVVYWFELKRDGGKASFIPHLIHNDSGVGTEVMAVDLNGDKKLDVVVGNKRGCFVSIRQ